MKSRNKRLVVFNQHSSFITIDIVNAFVKKCDYEEVVLVTGVVNEREDILDKSVIVEKTVPYKKDSFITRLSSWMSAFIKFLFLLTFKYRHSDVFLVTNPPLISFFPYLSCTKNFAVLVFDIYPDALSAGGFVSEKSLIYKIWAKANRKLFARANRIYTISAGMRDRLGQYTDVNKVELIHLWSSFEPEIIKKEDNRFLKDNNLQDAFIVMYSGNMGKGCGLESIVDVADRLKAHKDILFLFVGDGWTVPVLQKKVQELGLKNCHFMPYQDASILRHSLSAADVAVISLPGQTGTISIPNKLYTLIALGRPLLSLTPPDTDLYKVMKQFDLGGTFETQDVDAMVNYILELKSNEEFKQKLANNSITASKAFSKDNATKFNII